MSTQRMSMRPSSGESGIRLQPDNFISKLTLSASDTLNKLQGIWIEAGYEDAECQSLLGDLLGKIKLTFITEVAAEEQILEHAKQEVASKVDDYYSFCAQLGRIPAAGCGAERQPHRCFGSWHGQPESRCVPGENHLAHGRSEEPESGEAVS